MRHRRVRFLRIAALLALSLGFHPSSAGAFAGTGSLTPWAGVFVPTRDRYSAVEADVKRNSSFIAGGELTWFPKGLLGLELSAGWSPAHTGVAGASINESRALDALVASARLLVGLSPALSPVAVFAKVGPAYIRYKDPLNDDHHFADFGGVLGVGASLPFSPAIGLRLDGDDYMYGGTFDGSRKWQNDLVISAGIALHM